MSNDITDEDILNFKKDLDNLKVDRLNGNVRGIEFVEGPYDGGKFCIAFSQGEPTNNEVALSLTGCFTFNEPTNAAYYQWNKTKGKYIYSRIGLKTWHRDDD